MLRGRWSRQVGLWLTLPILTAVLLVAPMLRPASSASAQGAAGVLTAVTTDGALRAIDGRSWRVIAPDVARGATVTGIAWHPTRPEVLLVRRTLSAGQSPEPSYTLVYLDLASGREQTIMEGVGPQAQLVGPQIAPDGRSGFVRLECCLSREIVSFALPLTGQPPQQGPAGGFLSAEAREVALVTAGGYTPDGRILMTAECCMGDEPASRPHGLYRVAADLTSAERLAPDITGLPLGLGPGGRWAAVLEPLELSPEEGPSDAWKLSVIDLPSGARRPPLGEGEMWLAPAGAVGPDGVIAVAALTPGDDPWRPYGNLFRVSADGGISPGPELDTAATAFGWASPAAVGAARTGVRAAPEQSSMKAPTADFPHEVKVYFSRRPESEDDFLAVYPVTRMVGDAGVAHGALEELLRGPTPEEQTAGYFSELGEMVVGPSDCGEEPFTLRIEQGTATLRFCRMVTSAGIGQDARTFSQLKATLLQFPTIQRFRLLTRDGDCLFDESGENRCLTHPLR